jgi:hypothetical protein
VAGAFAALLFTGSVLSGDSNASDADIAAICERPLAPLTGNAVSEPRLIAAISGMRDISASAALGDVTRAESLFYTTDAHNVSHDIDAMLRLSQPELARRLCESVIRLENEIAGDLRRDVLAREANAIADALDEARAGLDLGATPAPISGASIACASPIGAVSSDPLTPARLEAAIADMREVASLAGDDDVDGASARFSGDAHNITHDIDGPLRNIDAQLAVDLCESVIILEGELGDPQPDLGLVAREAETSAGILEQAGRALGITR